LRRHRSTILTVERSRRLTPTPHLPAAVVDTKGQVHQHGAFCEKGPPPFSFGEDCRKDGVASCKVMQSGIVVITNTMEILAIADWDEPRVLRLSAPALLRAPEEWCCLQPRHSMSGGIEVLLGTKSTVMVAEQQMCVDVKLDVPPVFKVRGRPWSMTRYLR